MIEQPKDDLGRDVDLDEEEAYLADGERLTNTVADEIVTERPERPERPSGRPSLTAPGKHSPQIAFRVDEKLYAEIRSLAAASGMSVSEFGRRAVSAYVEQRRKTS
jgi:hypothetical protein